MKIITSSLFLFTTLLLFSCGSTEQLSNSGTLNEKYCHPDESAVLWQQTSAEYKALCHQAYNIASNYLISNEMDDIITDKPKAIVMDLDETVLDNSPYNAYLILNNEKFSENSWAKWVSKASAKAVPGAIEFINFARDKDFKIFFISNRPEELMEETLANLEKIGVNAKTEELLLKKENSSKISRREQVQNNNEIIMLVGDNLRDFNEELDQDLTINQREILVNETFKEFFGAKFIIMPNPLYGSWENALNHEKNADQIKNDRFDGKLKYMESF